MERYTPTYVKNTLSAFGLAPLKSLGQNFLCDGNLLQKLADTVPSGCGILEIGPGLGALTERLTARGRTLAYELDEGFCRALSSGFADDKNLLLRHADALKADIVADCASFFGETPVYVCANLPYYITSALIMRLLSCGREFCGMTLLMQREVAQKLLSPPGGDGYNQVTAALSYFYDASPFATIPPTCFYPAPEVCSAAVLLSPRRHGLSEKYLYAVRLLFSNRRKQIVNNLGLPRREALLLLEKAGVDPALRAEKLPPSDIENIARLL